MPAKTFEVIYSNVFFSFPSCSFHYHSVPEEPEGEERHIAFFKGTSVGLRLIGGNEVGIYVTAIQPNSPAEHSGVRVGDRIVQVRLCLFVVVCLCVSVCRWVCVCVSMYVYFLFVCVSVELK